MTVIPGSQGSAVLLLRATAFSTPKSRVFAPLGMTCCERSVNSEEHPTLEG
jgi:hypothetical protein